jgi:hypothetical protein
MVEREIFGRTPSEKVCDAIRAVPMLLLVGLWGAITEMAQWIIFLLVVSWLGSVMEDGELSS